MKKLLWKGLALSLATCLMMGTLAGCSKPEPQAAAPTGAEPGSEAQLLEQMKAEYQKTYNLQPLSEEDAKYVVTVGYYNCDHMVGGCIAEATGIYKALDLNVSLLGNAKVPESMSAGQMDVGYCGFTTTLKSVPKGAPLFIAAENHTGGAEYLVVANHIKTAQDLIGKKIATGADPETRSANWMQWSKELGIPSDISKYENFVMTDHDEYMAMKAGQLDAFICCDPWGSMAEYEGTGWTMAHMDTNHDFGKGTCCKYTMNTNFAAAHPELAKRMVLAHSLALQYIYQHPYKAGEIFAEYYSVPKEVGLITIWKKTNVEGRTLSWDFKPDELANEVKHYLGLGVHQDIAEVKLEDCYNMTYAKESGAKDFDTFISQEVDPIFPMGMTYEDWRKKAVEIDNIKE